MTKLRSSCAGMCVVAILLSAAQPASAQDDAAFARRPWVVFSANANADDQPLRRLSLHAEYITLLSDAGTWRAWVTPRLLTDPDRALQVTRTDAGVGAAWSAQALRADVRGGVSIGANERQAIGSAQLGVVRSGIEWNAAARRRVYESTLASLDSLVMVTGVEAGIDASAGQRWAGAARVHLDRFDDDNAIFTAYGWLLAPAVSGLRIGYAAAWQDSREMRFTRQPTSGPTARPAARADTIAGWYSPYYTPARAMTHSALLAAQLGRLRAQASLPIYARDDAPVLVRGVGSDLLLTTYARRYHPWRIGADWSPAGNPALQWSVNASYERKAYYSQGHVGVTATWRPVIRGR